MKVLLVEDDEDKAQRIAEFLSSTFENVNLEIARSFNSALKALLRLSRGCDLLVLDMSMPSCDPSEEDPAGGVPESFAGSDLMAQMQLRRIAIPTIVVTMFDSHGKGESKKSLEQLRAELAHKYKPNFLGLVYYNSSQEGWREALGKLIRSSGAV